MLRNLTQSSVVTREIIGKTENQKGGNATEFNAVFRSHWIKHWKNGKSDAVIAEITKLGI